VALLAIPLQAWSTPKNAVSAFLLHPGFCCRDDILNIEPLGCGSAISNGGVLATDGLAGCSMLCNGNLSEYCGGSSHLDVYDFNGVVSLPPWTVSDPLECSFPSLGLHKLYS